MNKRTQTRILNLLNIVAGQDQLVCSKCGLNAVCPVYQKLNPELRKKLRKGEYLTSTEAGIHMSNIRLATDICYTTIMAEVARHLVPDFKEVRIG